MAFYKEINDVYAKYFVDNLPARTCIAVLGLPKSAKVEIDIVAVKSSRKKVKKN